MAMYFTSDFHLGDTMFIERGIRKFRSVERMNDVLINNVNQRIQPGDVVYHLGDFVSYGKCSGVEGLRISGEEYRRRISGDFILIEGNHDANNKVKTHLKFLVLDIPGVGEGITAAHFPSWYPEMAHYAGMFSGKRSSRIHLCGHVHDKWLWRFDTEHRILNINVGVDEWDYQLVSQKALIKLVNGLKDRS